MIIKTNKAGKELESWPTLEEAAKAIKLAPAVLKSHMQKGKPKRLDGFIFKLRDEVPATAITAQDSVDITFTQSTGQVEYLEEATGNRRFWKVEEVTSEINYQPTPEPFDGPKLPNFTADEASMFPTPYLTPANPVMLDEYGDPIKGNPTIPPELSETEKAEEDLRQKARLQQKDYPEAVEHVDMAQVADYLRTPLQRRLHDIKNKK